MARGQGGTVRASLMRGQWARWLQPRPPHGALVAAAAALAVPVWLPLGVMLWEALAAGARLPSCDARFWALSGRSLAVATGAAALAALLGAPVGCLLARVDLPARSWVRALQVVPLLVPPYVAAIGWLHLLGRAGPVNRALAALLGLRAPPLNPYTMGGVVWVLGLVASPLASLPLAAALERANPELEEEARLHSGPWGVLWHVTLPLALPALVSGMVLAWLVALSEFAVPSFFGVHVYTVEVFTRFGAFFDHRAGTMAALPLLALGLAAFWLQGLLDERHAVAVVEASASLVPRRYSGRWRWGALALCLLPTLLGALLPLAALAYRAPAPADYAFAWQAASGEVVNSLLFALLASGSAVVAALPIAWLVARAPDRRLGNAVQGLAMAPLAVPGLVLGIGMIRLWNRGLPWQWVYRSPAIVVLGELAHALPFATVSLAAVWRTVPSALEDAARLSGATTLEAGRRLLLPLLRPGVVAAWALAFVAAVSELQTTLLVYPPGAATLPVRIFTLQHDGIAENVAALCLIQVAVTALPAAAVWALAGRREREDEL